MGETFTAQLPDVEELTLEQLLTFEKDLLGFYLHEPPYLAKLDKIHDFTSGRLGDLTEEHVGQKLTLGGVITEVKKVLTKKTGAEMAFIKISDGISEIECVIFPQTFGLSKEFLVRDEVVLLWGKIDKREETISLVVDNAELFDPDMAHRVERTIEIVVPKDTGVELLQQINRTLRDFPGESKVTLLLPTGDREPRRMVLPFSIDPNTALELEIKNILGEGAFRKI